MALTEQRNHPPLLHRPGLRRIAVFRALRLGDLLCAVPALRALRAALPHAHITLIALPWAEQFAQRFAKYVDEFIPFPGHPAFPEQAVREYNIPRFYQAMRARHFDLALQMHGSGEISNGIVSAFGARVTAGFVADSARMSDRFLPYPASGLEPRRLLQLVQFLGATPQGDHLEFPLDEQDKCELEAAGITGGLREGSYICIHPGASTLEKCWPLKRFAEVAERLHREFQLPIVLTGSPQEAELVATVAGQMRVKAINAAPPSSIGLSIGAMASLLSRSRLLVCNDTGVSHIAAGLKLPSVVIFSTADMRRWAPVDQDLHRCIRDPQGRKAAKVVSLARQLLRASA
jgi:ADP-heptose:LPS heptosyltransferase